MKVLVIGGAGFIGSNLTERLVIEGHDVIVLDNLSVGSHDNLVDISCTFIIGDMNDEDLLRKCLVGVNYVFFQAGPSSAPMYESNPPDTVSSSLTGFLKTLELSKSSGVKRVIYASSSSIYGNVKPPHSESLHLPAPVNFYSETKIAMERFAYLYSKLNNLDTIGLRYFSVYGPKEESKGCYANVVHQFFWKMKVGEAPIIYGDGTQSRDFIHVSDVIKANLLAMSNGTSGEAYNVGTGVEHTFNQVIIILNQYMNTNIRPKYIENPIFNYVQNTLADVKKAKRDLKFQAGTSLSDGLKELVKREFNNY
jgi:UDP-glucose 4-epimerase